jgi:hypothetical protein
VMPDHLISSIASIHSVTVMPSRYVRNATFSCWTMNWPENRDNAGTKQKTIRIIDVKG